MAQNAQAHPSAGAHHYGRAALLLTTAAAVVGTSIYAQRHADELATLGRHYPVPADPQT